MLLKPHGGNVLLLNASTLRRTHRSRGESSRAAGLTVRVRSSSDSGAQIRGTFSARHVVVAK
jgi:hypothetical protein